MKTHLHSLLILLSAGFMSFAFGADRTPYLQPFVSDGCSAPKSLTFGDYTSCCTRHDLAYWMGGTLEDKNRADSALIGCLKSKGASAFTAGAWQAMLSNFGKNRWGIRWIPRRENAPLTEEEKKIINRQAGIFRSEIPLVESYKDNTCSSALAERFQSITSLKDPTKITCYKLTNSTPAEKKTYTLVYSPECDIGYFVHSTEGGYESLGGYGTCADMIKPERQNSSVPPDKGFEKVPAFTVQ